MRKSLIILLFSIGTLAFCSESELLERIKYLNDPKDNRSRIIYDRNIGIDNLEKTIWWDANRLIGFDYNKRIIFFDGKFLVHDMNEGPVVYGT
ncbi:hypothetical protein [Breznakiella homolactica]|uniref:Uncharacterized protein n=1 Tax=Breznakiella homolactica TaxID=2798577 RepID=A0A7T7XK64_9SPIR|nr:hypothetical protein [Breznakiella homolactica]QQO07702.1 hypothetical protein JFL75_12185 [Breznakiella homolactica]